MKEKVEKRIRRHRRIRKKILGTQVRPRLCVYRGLSNTRAQIIDDISAKTLFSLSTESKAFKKEMPYGGNVKAAKLLGKLIAEGAKKKGITEIIFDRGGFLYHGRIRALAESCREHGLKL